VKKRIFIQTVLLTSISVFLVSIILCVVFYSQLAAQARAELQLRTEAFQDMNAENAKIILVNIAPEDMRVTIILADGTVQFDNTANPKDLGSHLDREEIEEALSFGEGESRRYSDTLNTETFYYAIRLTDGSVLRTAKTVGSIWGMFIGILPVTIITVLVFIIAAYIISGQLAKKVVKPINTVDLSDEPNVPYDELIPFAKTIMDHRKQIVQSSEKLRQRTDTINAIMDNMDEGVVMLDRRGTILSINKSATVIFNRPQSLEGRNALELLRDLDFHQHIKQALKGNREEMVFHRSNKEYRVLISPVSELGVIVLFMDITEKAKAEKMRREFSANVSHELKTPLTSIYGNAEMLEAGVVKDEDQPVFYSKIMNEASRLIALIEDIMLLSELDEGTAREQFEQVNLAHIASECVAALEQKFAEHQVTVTVSGGAVMRASHSLMHEMIYNLLDNAIKYNNPGGQVNIDMSQTDSDICLKVSDNGIGISEPDLKRIFERFYRADKSRSKKSGGTGLGLAIVKHVVMMHGGNIKVTSEMGVGAEFEIIFDVSSYQ
jgi:PAS domain S-box